MEQIEAPMAYEALSGNTPVVFTQYECWECGTIRVDPRGNPRGEAIGHVRDTGHNVIYMHGTEEYFSALRTQ